jgi:monovalent cation/hydrogen antiporter
MPVFELVVGLLFAGALMSSVARRLNAPYPALLALLGAGLALLPDVPSVMLDPELALALLVAPVLLDSAFDASPRDLKQNWKPVTALALAAVCLTVVAVAVVAHWLVPPLPWAGAIVLGAIVAPPDAAAAMAVLRQIRPPHRVLVILEGESLFNDATALLIYRFAVAAAVTGAISAGSVVPTLLTVSIGSVVLGLVLSRVVLFVTARVTDVSTAVIMQFVSTFAVWMLAERLHLSGIITMVVFAISVARRAPDLIPARLRIPSYAVWEVAVFVLNVLAFLLIGLQLKPILQRLNSAELISYTQVAVAVCGAVIVVRLIWVMGYALVAKFFARRDRERGEEGALYPSIRIAAVIAWCGMRGIVTLAAALALPIDFPHRDLILFSSFAVVLVTLVVQGMTVSPLIGALKLGDDGEVEREVRLARAETARAALDAVDGDASGAEMVRLLQRKYEARLRRAEGEPNQDNAAEADGAPAYVEALKRAQAAERRTLSELRSEGTIGDDAFHKLEEELDWAEINAEAIIGRPPG